MYTVAGILSLIFVSVTLYLYLTLPKLKNMQGNIVIANLVAVLLTTTTLVILYNASPEGFIEEPTIIIEKSICIVLGYGLYFFGLSMFCWMAVLGFDLFLTFGPKNFRLHIEKKRKRLLIYTFLGSGIPAIMLTAIIVLEFFQIGSIVPDVGVNRCFLSFQASEYFFYFPIFLILCFNAVMFSATTVSLVRSHRSSRLAREGRVRSTTTTATTTHNSTTTVSSSVSQSTFPLA